jgi:hypothetical protein
MEIKQCPICGRTPRILENKFDLNDIVYGVYCCDEHHSISIGCFGSEEEAIEVWNNKF